MVNQITTAAPLAHTAALCVAASRNPEGDAPIDMGGHVLASAIGQANPVRRSANACDPRLMALGGPRAKQLVHIEKAAPCALLRATVIESTSRQV
jgi:hypothetical protein